MIIPLCLVVWTILTALQTFTCTTAAAHAHDVIREGQINVTAWDGCTLIGSIDGGVELQLWADKSSCPLRDKVPGTFQIRYDLTCGQVLDLSTGELPAHCPPSPTPTPTPTPSPSPTPEPTPTTPECSISAPPFVSIPPNGTGTIAVAMTSSVRTTLTAQAVSSNAGQVSVTPTTQTMTGTSVEFVFLVKVKRKNGTITFSSPCGTVKTVVSVR